MLGFNTPGAGDLRERVRFETRQTTQSPLGPTRGPWTPALTGVPAEIAPFKGADQIVASGQQATATWTVTVRGSAAAAAVVANDFRIVNERTGETFKIVYAQNPDQKRRWYVYTVQTGTAQ